MVAMGFLDSATFDRHTSAMPRRALSMPDSLDRLALDNEAQTVRLLRPPPPSNVRQASPVIPLLLEDDAESDGEALSIKCTQNICASDMNECTESHLQRLAAQRQPRWKLPRSMSEGACLSFLADDLNGSVEFLGDPRALSKLRRSASKGALSGLDTLREGVEEVAARSRNASGILDAAGQLHVPATPSSTELLFDG